jgi:hypothetical protein
VLELDSSSELLDHSPDSPFEFIASVTIDASGGDGDSRGEGLGLLLAYASRSLALAAAGTQHDRHDSDRI